MHALRFRMPRSSTTSVSRNHVWRYSKDALEDSRSALLKSDRKDRRSSLVGEPCISWTQQRNRPHFFGTLQISSRLTIARNHFLPVAVTATRICSNARCANQRERGELWRWYDARRQHLRIEPGPPRQPTMEDATVPVNPARRGYNGKTPI